MKILINRLDKSAISLSLICIAHCLALPILIILIPSISTIPFINLEAFHIVMVVLVIPISLFALIMGCKKHKKPALLYYGILGLFILIIAIIFGESHLGEFGEKILTTIGAIAIATTHLKNYKLCRQPTPCAK